MPLLTCADSSTWRLQRVAVASLVDGGVCVMNCELSSRLDCRALSTMHDSKASNVAEA